MTLGQRIALRKYQEDIAAAKCCICGLEDGPWVELIIVKYRGARDELQCRDCYENGGPKALGGVEK